MSNRASEFDMAYFLEERGWLPSIKDNRAYWTHETLKWPWPLAEAYRLQTAADRGSRGLLFKDLREWACKRKVAAS
jgi:hypothetical protein